MEQLHSTGGYDADYALVNGMPVITKTSGKPFFDDKTKRPVAIQRIIVRVPVICGGNSDSGQAMIQYTTESKYKSFCLIVHHADAEIV